MTASLLERRFGRIDEMFDQPIIFQVVGPIDQVFPHQVLCKRECRECRVLDHFESWDVSYRLTHMCEYQWDINASVIGGKFPLKLVHLEPEIPLQELQEGGVNPNVVFVVRQIKVRLRRATFE